MSGTNNFVAKGFSLLMNMDKMIGGQFEKGLQKLGTVATPSGSAQGLRYFRARLALRRGRLVEKNRTVTGVRPVLRMYEEICLRSLADPRIHDRLRSDTRRSFEPRWRRRGQCARD